MVVYLFPGQGSQHRGMGSSLFDEFRTLTDQANNVLGYSVKELCLDDPHGILQETAFTQPALYVVNAFSYLKRLQEKKAVPDYVAGHSLGEYNALFAAEVFDFETGLRLVKKRAELMSSVTNGRMAAVTGVTLPEVKQILGYHGLPGVDIASENGPTQVVLSGLRWELEVAKACLEAVAGVNFIPLKVSGPFHSRYMSQAAKDFEVFLNNFTFLPPTIPVIANVHAGPYRLEHVRRNLVEQMTRPVKWTQTIQFFIRHQVTDFEEIGPGSVLTNLVKSITIDNKEEPLQIEAAALGSREFRQSYNLKYAYVTGSMYRGIASEQLVIRVAKAGMLGFFGTGGLSLTRIESAIQEIQGNLKDGQAYGMNLLHQPENKALEDAIVDLFLRYNVRCIEASAYINLSSALIRFRAKGLVREPDGSVVISKRIMAKVSRPEVAEVFLSPAPHRMVSRLLDENKITKDEAALLREVPMADDLCVEADSGGHTDQGVMSVLLPTMIRLRDRLMDKYGYGLRVRVGAAGGIGTPEAAAAAFIYGADFILTGSINQCTVEAGTSDTVKDLLQQLGIQDTDHVPAGDLFEMGSLVQVVKKGLFFPSRARKLYELYQRFGSLEEVDDLTRRLLEEKYFRQRLTQVYEEVKAHMSKTERQGDKEHPKRQMARVFKWYFWQSTGWAQSGDPDRHLDYQIHSGPAMGAFNQWVKDTPWEHWKSRHVDEIGLKLMEDTAEYLNKSYGQLLRDTVTARP